MRSRMSFVSCAMNLICQRTGLTQKKSACFLGVPAKPVEAWEDGRHHPDGAAYRLLAPTKAGPEITTSESTREMK